MASEHRLLAILILAVLVCVMTFTLSCTYRSVEFMRNGYCEQQGNGRTEPLWVKCK
jgi:hypothetical protein